MEAPLNSLLLSCSALVPVPWKGARAVVHTPQCIKLKNVHKQLGKGINYREIGGKFGVSASTAYEKVNTVGTDETCSD